MLTGDLSTMSLADLLQWADTTFAAGVLTIARPSAPVWLQIADRHVVACARPPIQGVLPFGLRLDDAQRAALALDDRALALEVLYDQFLDNADRFRFVPGATPADPGVALDLSLQEAVMNGMHMADEWQHTCKLYESGRARIRRLDVEVAAERHPVRRALLVLAEFEVSLDDARLALGISQPSLLRNVEMCRRLEYLAVDGANDVTDLDQRLVQNAVLLLEAKQFDEASHVLSTLLSAHPGSRRIREMLQHVEQAFVAELYGAVPANARVRRTRRIGAIAPLLTRADREVIEHIDGQGDVARLVLASPLREVETLKSLRKLHRFEAIALDAPAEPEGRPQP